MPRSLDGLDHWLPPVVSWFRTTFGQPTPPQRRGWPEISAGRNTLIVAPTGSGKTLAAFLACLEHLWRVPRKQTGVRILYISPLKALNQDVSRNLREPLDGILATAEAAGFPLRPLSVGVRSGDTPPADRQRMLRNPPDILITTPESLHLLLASRARDTLRSVSHVIVDEIHALCPNKRGVFLSLLLERLQANNPEGFVRIGLSATQRPLEEAARFLGGFARVDSPDGSARFVPRPVTIVDTGRRKELDLQVLAPFDRIAVFGPAGTVWPAIEERVLKLISEHRSTIVFANNRRVAERLTSHLNELADPDANRPEQLARAHHGSLSIEERRTTEDLLKNGELSAVVSTASLELGIDMGAVDLVCQVESPGSVSRGLQRVGRAGHVVGRVSKGRLIAKTPADLLESAAVTRAMLQGDIETLKVPGACLDVLAQQLVACVAMDVWSVPVLFDLVRCAYPYRNLSASAFESVLRMVSGRFPTEEFRDLRARISWDRVHNRLNALPGTARLALTGGGTIPDTGHYPVYLGEEGPRLGELDEEFVHEIRVGDTFLLGTSTWRIETIEPHRVLVSSAEGEVATTPFWRGEAAPRTAELGEAVGRLCREIVERVEDPRVFEWLADECRLEPNAARGLFDFVARQLRVAGAVPDDQTILVESFRDPTGEIGMAVLTPFGGRLHQALKLAIQGRLRERLGISVACLHGDEGVLIRLPKLDEAPLDVFTGLNAEHAEALIREELGDSALFGLRFRQNAGRAMLMPRPDPSKRTPLWLQRLRAKDLLQVVRRFPDFPIVVETYRECLDDDLDLPRLRAFLTSVESGSIRVVIRRGEIASPFGSSLIFQFTAQYVYEWDEPRRSDRAPVPTVVDESLLDPLLDPETHAQWLNPTAIGRVENRLRGVGHPPRTTDEMAEALLRLGDLTPSELSGPMPAFLATLEQEGRATQIELSGTTEPVRWINVEEQALYDSAFGAEADESVLEVIVRRYLAAHALIGFDELIARYPIDPAVATDLLERWAESGRLVRLDPADETEPARWADRRNLDEVRRISIAIRRSEAVAVVPEVFADFVARRQRVHPSARWEGSAALALVLEQLQGFAAPADLWETELFPRRVKDYRNAWLDELLASGMWYWRAEGEGRGEPRVAFASREFGGGWPLPEDSAPLEGDPALVREQLARRGASFVVDLARELEPSRVRSSLIRLLHRGDVTNDRFDPLRPGARSMDEALAQATMSVKARRAALGRARLRRPATDRPEGRWSLLEALTPGAESSCLAWAATLLERYGVLARETAALDPWAPPWRELAPWLARAELRGELRRGYFVEGLSGVQYATDDAAEELTRLSAHPGREDEPVLISTLDPANLYGAGAALDIDLLEGGTARLPRNSGNFLVLSRGRPVLIIEAFGKRLTGLTSASESELRAALATLPQLAGPSRRVLKVETYNLAATLASPIAGWLAEVGFVRDYPGMSYYAGW